MSGWRRDMSPCVVAAVEEVNRATAERDAAWDIDRLEPEGSCRIGTHCQRLGYHHRLPASEGGRATRRNGKSR